MMLYFKVASLFFLASRFCEAENYFLPHKTCENITDYWGHSSMHLLGEAKNIENCALLCNELNNAYKEEAEAGMKKASNWCFNIVFKSSGGCYSSTSLLTKKEIGSAVYRLNNANKYPCKSDSNDISSCENGGKCEYGNNKILECKCTDKYTGTTCGNEIEKEKDTPDDEIEKEKDTELWIYLLSAIIGCAVLLIFIGFAVKKLRDWYRASKKEQFNPNHDDTDFSPSYHGYSPVYHGYSPGLTPSYHGYSPGLTQQQPPQQQPPQQQPPPYPGYSQQKEHIYENIKEVRSIGEPLIEVPKLQRIPAESNIDDSDWGYENDNTNVFTLKQNKRLFVFADIHGDYEKIDELFKNAQITYEDTVVITGDFCGRGIYGLEIFLYLLKLRREFKEQHNDKGGNLIILAGNHEMFLTVRYFGFINEKSSIRDHTGNGKLPKKMQEVFNKLPVVCQVDKFICSHAGITQKFLQSSGITSFDAINELYQTEIFEMITDLEKNPDKLWENIFNADQNHYKIITNLRTGYSPIMNSEFYQKRSPKIDIKDQPNAAAVKNLNGAFDEMKNWTTSPKPTVQIVGHMGHPTVRCVLAETYSFYCIDVTMSRWMEPQVGKPYDQYDKTDFYAYLKFKKGDGSGTIFYKSYGVINTVLYNGQQKKTFQGVGGEITYGKIFERTLAIQGYRLPLKKQTAVDHPEYPVYYFT